MFYPTGGFLFTTYFTKPFFTGLFEIFDFSSHCSKITYNQDAQVLLVKTLLMTGRIRSNSL